MRSLHTPEQVQQARDKPRRAASHTCSHVSFLTLPPATLCPDGGPPGWAAALAGSVSKGMFFGFGMPSVLPRFNGSFNR